MLSNPFSFLFFDFSQGILYFKNTIDPKTLQQFYQNGQKVTMYITFLAAPILCLSRTSKAK